MNVKILLVPLLIITILGACSAKKSYNKSEFDFANKLAQAELWKEAYFRWQRVLAAGKESAALYNNMAIALEEMGKFDEAEKMYKKALKLSPNRQEIQGNYVKMKKHLKKDKEKDKDKDKKKGKNKKKRKDGNEDEK